MKHEDLRRLKELKHKGIITEEEFEKRKEKLIEFKAIHHTYHVEPSHQKEMDKAHEASINGEHPASSHLHVPLTLYHEKRHETKGYHHGGTKSKFLAGFLGIFLGAFGIHNFYTAHYMKGIVQLLLTVLSSGVFFIIPIVWGMVEGALILFGVIKEDAHNIPLK